jgi:quercetin dioxygenase-like cupin family protein
MKPKLATIAAGLALACGSAAWAEVVDAHKAILPQAIKWQAAPGSLPAGAEFAVLEGDPTREGMFTMRVKTPKGYRIPPHTHPKAEALTVISGAISLGRGQSADRAGLEALPAGSFAIMPAGVLHYVFVDEDAVIQVSSAGPWGIDYYDPKDDPRLNIAPSK